MDLSLFLLLNIIICVIISLVLLISVPVYVNDVFGHGLGMDMAPPVNFGDSKVTIITQISPQDLSVGNVDSANLAIRFFDQLTNQNFNSVTYQVEVWRSGELLARDIFYDSTGDLNVEVRPEFGCTESDKWKCTTVYGEEEPILGGKFARGEGRPVIEGPIFDKGGLYNVNVEILSAVSPKQLVAERLIFDTFVSVAQEQDFIIQTAQAEEIPVVVKTYYDDVNNFKFDNNDNSISFDMPFDWRPDYVDLVQVVHEEIQVPKTFDPYKEGNKLKGYVDGVEVDSRVLLIDPYSYEDTNILHFLVTGTELKRINEELGSKHHDKKTIFFELVPQSELQKNSFDIKFNTGMTVKMSWDSNLGVGDEIPFEFTFVDQNGKLVKDLRYGYSISDNKGNEIFANVDTNTMNPGILASEGIDIQRITIPSQDIYKMNVIIFGQGINNDQKYAGTASSFFEVGPQGQKSPKEISIPDWVRNNAKWWSEGSIGDKDFASGIQFMIKERIIKIPTTENGQANQNVKIPDWVRNNAKWWSEGSIGDKDFASGIQYLIKIGIISV